MSALPPKADIAERNHHVRFVPQPDIAPLVDDLVRELSCCLTKPPMLNPATFINSHRSVVTSRPCERNHNLRIDRQDRPRTDGQ
jgi:hypothetical protein